MRKGTKTTKAHKRKKSSNARLQQITRVAANLFFEKGFWQTTTKEIAEACNISVGTLYYYSKSKYDFPLIFSRVKNAVTAKASGSFNDSHSIGRIENRASAPLEIEMAIVST